MAGTRELAASSCRGKLGDRAMVRMEPRQVTLYRVEWEYNGHYFKSTDGLFDDSTAVHEPLRRVRVKSFRTKTAAYKWMALRLIFAKRDKLATRFSDQGYPDGCRLCDIEANKPWHGAPDEAPTTACRYHDHDSLDFKQLCARLARWLRWRDSRLEAAK